MAVPADIGRITHRIDSGCSSFTASQVKNWITVFSIPALHCFVPPEHFECWHLLVLACRILCKRNLATAEENLCDLLLLQFCKHVQDISGEEAITPYISTCTHTSKILVKNLHFGCFPINDTMGYLETNQTITKQ